MELKQKFIICLSLFVIFLSIAPSMAMAREESTNSIKIGVEINTPPYSYIDDNGMIKGFNVDLVRAVAIELGVDIELYAQTATDLKKNLMDHRLDAIVSSNIEENNYLVSKGIIESRDGIFVRSDNKYISDLEGFWNSTVAINNQSLTTMISTYLDNYNAQDAKIVLDQEHGFLLLMNNEVDSYIGNKDAGMYLIQKWNQEKYIKAVGEAFNISNYAFYTNVSNKELLGQLDKGLDAAIRNYSYEKVYQKWFGESAATYDKKIRRIFIIASILAIIVSSLMIIAVKWNKTLKKEVDRRTKELNQANEVLRSQQNDLKDKEQFKEDILNSSPTGMITLSKKGYITSVNAKARQVLNITEDYQNEQLTNVFLEQDKIDDVLQNGTQYIGLEGEIIVNELARILSYQIYPLRNSQREVIGAIINFEDISKERRLEEEMTKVDKMKSLDLLVSEFVHEIRTPLTSIKAMTELMPYKINNLEFRRNMLEIVSMEVNRLDSLVTTLSEYAKPRNGNFSVFEIKKVIENVILLLQRKILEKDVEITIDFASDLQVYGDKMQLMQVFINLILNSLESLQKQGKIIIKR